MELFIREKIYFTFYKIFRYLIIILFISFSSGQNTYSISGKLLDKDGEDMRDAKLNLYKSNKYLVKQEKSGRSGKFKFSKLKPDKYTINIYGKNGYSQTKEIDLTGGDVKNLEITPITKPGSRYIK